MKGKRRKLNETGVRYRFLLRALYLNVLAGQELRRKPLESFGQDWLNCTACGPPLNFTLRWPKKLPVQ